MPAISASVSSLNWGSWHAGDERPKHQNALANASKREEPAHPGPSQGSNVAPSGRVGGFKSLFVVARSVPLGSTWNAFLEH